MKIFEANISHQVLTFLGNCLKNSSSVNIANQKIVKACGIKYFFDDENDFKVLLQSISSTNMNVVEEPDRAEYGDYQTNTELADKITRHLSLKNISPQIIIEPTCGKGNFIVASLSNFKTIKKVYGIMRIYQILDETCFCSTPQLECKEYDFYNHKNTLSFGWSNSKFVSNISDYNETKEIDGICPFEWRQGIKHDCTSIMELEKVNDHYVNKFSEEICLEDDLIYGILKSSDLKNTVIRQTRKYVIVTQKKVGQETSYIQQLYPETYSYLKQNLKHFQSRKSSIYKRKPPFSIFGIGDYSFKSYKVAISGLYKTYHFTLVLPQNQKPVMLDDTCYFIGFDKMEYAVFALILLNSFTTQEFFKSITFPDAKRVFTKDLLMRLDLLKLAELIPQKELEEQIVLINKKYELNINLSEWDRFVNEMQPAKEKQLSMFFIKI